MANLKQKDTYVYFLYSERQNEERSEIEKKMSRIFSPGTVVVNGRRHRFTEISKNPKNRYADCKVIAEGFKSKMVYTDVTTR